MATGSIGIFREQTIICRFLLPAGAMVHIPVILVMTPMERSAVYISTLLILKQTMRNELKEIMKAIHL